MSKLQKLKAFLIPSRKFYPRAHETQLPIADPNVRIPRQNFLKAALRNFLFLQLLFFGLFVYIFGALYQQGTKTHNLNVVFIDYDGGAVGMSIRSAYEELRGDGFFNLVEKESMSVREEDLRGLVCKSRYWATLSVKSGASARIETGLSGEVYEKDDILQYIWNEARYSAIIDSAISANLNTLSSLARVHYSLQNFTSIPFTANSITTFADPWHLQNVNIQPTTQGSRAIYNTLVIILILIQEFFYLGTINSLYDAFKIYTRLNPHRIITFRFLLSLLYCLIGSLCVTASIWIFKAGWNVNTAQFFLTWAVLWLFAHLNFLTLDVFTVWLPLPFVPMALITWVILNVTSILLPFELSSPFYRWGYAMPAHEVYQILIDIWSRGCNPTLHYSLPILFAYELSGLFLSGLGVHRRCHYAVIREENEKATFQAKIDAALGFERERGVRRMSTARRMGTAGTTSIAGQTSPIRRGSTVTTGDSKVETSDSAHEEQERVREDAKDQDLDREELSEVIERETTRIRREQSRGAGKGVDFGPSFGFRFGTEDE